MIVDYQSEAAGFIERSRRFWHRPLRGKLRSIYVRWVRWFPGIPFPVRLPFGAWWLARGDFMSASVFDESFEAPERSFFERFLRPGMIVLDIGAHYGYYTLLASKLVGPSGRVFSFEPSPRERLALVRHKKLNRCSNVTVQPLALGDRVGTAELHVVELSQSGLNSLTPPAADVQTSPVNVQVSTLNQWLRDQKLERVDFVKMDVEGGELAALRGASELVRPPFRPLFLVEVQDIRTKPWGYKAKEILDLLAAHRYSWFRVLDEGTLVELSRSRDELNGNFVAVPEEKLAALQVLHKALILLGDRNYSAHRAKTEKSKSAP